MFIYLAEMYTQNFTFLNLFNYITFRTGAAILTSLFFSLIFGEMIIKYLSSIQPIGQPIRKDGPERHIFEKTGTPTMGGILILSSIIISFVLWARLTNVYVWICLFTCIIFGLIGFLDDYKKIYSNNSKGLKASTRILLQIFFSFAIIFTIYNVLPENMNTTINLPFFKNLFIDFGIFFLIFGIIVIVGSANAVNLTDGLDGLAIVPVMIVFFSFAFIAYVSGNINFSQYLQISYI